MNTNRKVYFGVVRLISIIIMIVSCWSCQSKNEADSQSLSSEQISSNLLIDGVIDPALLIGEWDCIKFAYTADGTKISDIVKIKTASLEIPTVHTGTECEVYDPETGMHKASEKWLLRSSINGGGWICSLSKNLIKLTFCGSTKIGVPIPHEEWDLVWALDNAYSFVIKGNELMIFFSGDEKNKGFTSIAGDKKINLLIFNKR